MSTSIVNANGATISETIGRTMLQQAMQGDLTVASKFQRGFLRWRMSAPQKSAVINTVNFSLVGNPDDFRMQFLDIDITADATLAPDVIQLWDSDLKRVVGEIINLAVPNAGA